MSMYFSPEFAVDRKIYTGKNAKKIYLEKPMHDQISLTCSSLDEFIHASSEGFRIFYLSRPDCNVCKALLPKVINMAAQHKRDLYYVNLDDDPSIAGQLSIFTIPVLLIYIDGKEYIRQARHISLDQVGQELERLSNLYS